MSGTRQQLTDAACQSRILPVCVLNQAQLFFISVEACAWTSMSGTRQHFTDAACHSRIPPVCVWYQSQRFFICVRACALTSMSGTRQHFNDASCQRRIPPVVSVNMLTLLSALHDTVRKAWFPIAAWVQVMGDKAMAVVNRLEKRGLPVKLHFWKCIEGLIPPDLEEVTQYMGSSNMSLLMVTKKAKQLNAARVWEHHLCHGQPPG